jgi:autotransporter-associated beta strand protein
MVRDEAERLLPHPVIGSAPPGHVTLVNTETVLWVATAPDRRLGTVTLLGRRVAIRAHVERVAWDFGDDSSTTTTRPGTAYTNAHPCRTKQCPGYFGHTYSDTGTMTITADLTWTGQFRVDGGAWQTIPGTVIAAATSTSIDVKEARGVLVPNP